MTTCSFESTTCFNHLNALRQDDLQGEILDEHVVEHVVDDSHVEGEIVALGVEVFVRGDVVT